MINPELSQYELILVNTPAQDYSVMEENEQTGTVPSLGLESIATYLDKHGHKVGILDADYHALIPKQMVNLLEKQDVDYVGFNAVSENVHIAGWIAEQLSAKTIIGGIHPTLAPEQTIQRFPSLYAVVHGEGEKVMLDLLEGKPRKETDGVVFKENQIISNQRHEQSDLSDFPLSREKFVEDYDEVFLMTSRGCPYNCSFCASPILNRRIVRYRDMNEVVGYMKKKFENGRRKFHFLDDLFLITEERAQKFVRKLKEYGLFGRIEWRGMTRVDILLRLSDKVLRDLKKSGGKKMAVGVESGCERILKMVHKKINSGMTKKTVKRLNNFGFKIKAFFIFGFPTETYQEMCETRKFMMKLGEKGLDYFNIAILRPYPGTEIYNMLLGEGYSPDEIFYDDVKPLEASPNSHYVHGFQNQLNEDIQVSEVPVPILREFIADTTREFEERFG